jgi:hypothetical protein
MFKLFSDNLSGKSSSARTGLWCVFVAALLVVSPASAQNASPSSQRDDNTLTGTVTSSTARTLVVRGEGGQYQLFVFDSDTVKPRVLTSGSTVRVTSTPGDEPGVRLASQITVLTAAAAGAQSASSQSDQPVPPEVRRIERDIRREARRYQLGVRAGVALDPELILLGVQAQVGPFFNSNIFFRPNVEFGIGEVTALFALNPEIIYRLPATSRRGNWAPYVGIGPGFSFLHQNFQHTDSNNVGKRIDFGEFHSDAGLNILGGVRSRSGVFVELKTSVYANPAPVFRMMVGYNF